jgi:hypothetical protein
MTPQPICNTSILPLYLAGTQQPAVAMCSDCLSVRVDTPGATCVICLAARINRAKLAMDQSEARQFIVRSLVIVGILVLGVVAALVRGN